MDKKIVKKIPKTVRVEKPAAKKSDGSAKAKKTSARLGAVQVLYQMRLNNQDAKSATREYIQHRSGFKIDGDVLVAADENLLTGIVSGVNDRWSDIDDIVTGTLGKKTEPELLLLCILRAGAWELLAHGAADTGIVINDYMNVTNAFYDGKEVKLVNAVLDKIAKTVRA